LLWKVGCRPLAAQPSRDLRRVTPQCRDRRRHIDAEGGIDGLVAHAETEDHPTFGGIGDQARRPGAGVGVAHVDARDPGANLDPPGGLAHQLRRREGIVVDLGGKDRVETCIFRLDCDCLDFGSAPRRAGNDPETQPLRHPRSPFVYLLRGHYPGRRSAETPF
jgi:hypothetical protein